ncbi:hypothetical protein PSACC_01183 [Paramicrosporidium saccamoebae]|uniref:Secreted protein n=1 Tax=Paramicrosporidium saccamoebae TaxID=1246581 RepID=A0A2H9TMM8_9FUNG|nr:hypothetical protein PSACC_01183 [Paramicrosporidium saccamoebae]
MHRCRVFQETMILLLAVLFGSALSAVVPDFTPLTKVPPHDVWPTQVYTSGEIQRNTMHDKYIVYLEQGRYIAFIQALSVSRKPAIKEPALIPDYMDIHAAGGLPLEPSYQENTLQLISEINSIPEDGEGERALKRQVIRAYIRYHWQVYKSLNRLALTIFYPNSTATSTDHRVLIWAEELINQLEPKDMPEWAAIGYLKILTSKSASVERDRTGELSSSISFTYTQGFKQKLIDNLISRHLHKELLEYLRTLAGDDKAKRHRLSTKNLTSGKPVEEQTFFLKLNKYPANAFDAVMTILGDITISGDDKAKIMERFKQPMCASLKPNRPQNLARFFTMLALMPDPMAGSKPTGSWELRSLFIELCEPHRDVSWIKKVNEIVFKEQPALGTKVLEALLDHGIGSRAGKLDDFLPTTREALSRSVLEARHELQIPLTRPNLDISWLLHDKLHKPGQLEEIDGAQYLSEHGPIERSRRLFDIQIDRSPRSTAGRKSLSIETPLAFPDLTWMLHKDLQTSVHKYEIGGFHQLSVHGPRRRDRRLFDIQIGQPRRSTASRKSLSLDPPIRPDLSWLLPLAGRTIYRRAHPKSMLGFLKDRSHFDFDGIVLLGEMTKIQETLLSMTVKGQLPLTKLFETTGRMLFSEAHPETYKLFTNYATAAQLSFIKLNDSTKEAAADNKTKSVAFENNIRGDSAALASFYGERGLADSPGFIDMVVDLAKMASDNFPTKKMDADSPLAYPVARHVLCGICFGPVGDAVGPTRCQKFAEHLIHRYREQMLILMDMRTDSSMGASAVKQIDQLNEEYYKLMGDLHRIFLQEFSLTIENGFEKYEWQAGLYGDDAKMANTITLDYVRLLSSTLNLSTMAPFRLALYPWARHELLQAKDNGEFVDSELLRGLTHNNLILDMKFFFERKQSPTFFYTDGFKYFFTKAVHTLATTSGFPLPASVRLNRWSPQPVEAFPDCEPSPASQSQSATAEASAEGTDTTPPEERFAEARRQHQKELNDPIDPNISDTDPEYTCTERLLVLYFEQIQFPLHRVEIPPQFEWPRAVKGSRRPEEPLDTFIQEWLLDVYDQLSDNIGDRSVKFDALQALRLLSAYIRTLMKFMGFSPTIAHDLLVYMYSPLHDAVIQKGQELPSTSTITIKPKKAGAAAAPTSGLSSKEELEAKLRRRGEQG